jgi:predicted MFS family arabinose efflux permease
MEFERSYLRAWLIWGIAAVFYLYELVLRVSPSVMTNELMLSLNATSTTLGILISFYYYSYTILQLPCGIILDKLGPRNLLVISAILCVIGSTLFGTAEKIGLAQAGRFLVGTGSACAFVSCLQIAAHFFSKKYFAIVVGLTNIMGILGGLLGGFPVARLVNSVGWRHATYVLASIGIVIILMIFMIVPKSIAAKAKSETLKPLIKLVKNSQILLIGIVTGLMYLPISMFAELWATPFFSAKHNLNNEKASIISAALFVGVVIGSIVMAIVARKRGYTKTMRLSALCVLVLFMPLIYCSCSVNISLLLVFTIGFFTGAQVLGFTCAKNNVALELSGTTIALTNCIVMMIGAIFQSFLGSMLDFFWTGIIADNGSRIYEISCYQNALTIVPIFIAISYIITPFVKETIHTE